MTTTPTIVDWDTDNLPDRQEVQNFGDKVREILKRISYKDWRKLLNLDGGRWYFQFEWDAIDNVTGEPGYVARSAKYYLSPHMTQTEVVNRVFLAAVKAEEHETRELFMYRPEGEFNFRAPYNTHIDIDSLHSIAGQTDER